MITGIYSLPKKDLAVLKIDLNKCTYSLPIDFSFIYIYGFINPSNHKSLIK